MRFLEEEHHLITQFKRRKAPATLGLLITRIVIEVDERVALEDCRLVIISENKIAHGLGQLCRKGAI